MSILQEYEEIKKEIGNKKFNAIRKYIDYLGNEEKFNKEVIKIKSMEDFSEWFNKYKQIHEKYKPIFISDVIYDRKEWNKFEKWYKETRKHEKRNREER